VVYVWELQNNRSHLFDSRYVSTSRVSLSANKTDNSWGVYISWSRWNYRLSKKLFYFQIIKLWGHIVTIFTYSDLLSKFPSAAHERRNYCALTVFIIYIVYLAPVLDVEGTTWIASSHSCFVFGRSKVQTQRPFILCEIFTFLLSCSREILLYYLRLERKHFTPHRVAVVIY
jgi:hypothetical protein